MRPELVAEGGCAREAMRSDVLREVGIDLRRRLQRGER
jgi:hypothetical protein